MSEVFSVEGLAAGYGPLQVVADVSLQVAAGEVVAVLGRNGAGKTTTLLALAGIIRPYRGRVRLGEVPLEGRSAARIARHGVSLVPSGHRIFKQLTVDENLRVGAFVRRRRGNDWRLSKERVTELFPVLRAKKNQVAGELSGGEQQMLAIGQALLAGPQFLLLDEPSFGLAPAVVNAIYDALTHLSREGLGILVVEQEVQRALSSSDRVYLLENGRVVRHDTAERITTADVTAVMMSSRPRDPAVETEIDTDP